MLGTGHFRALQPKVTAGMLRNCSAENSMKSSAVFGYRIFASITSVKPAICMVSEILLLFWFAVRRVIRSSQPELALGKSMRRVRS